MVEIPTHGWAGDGNWPGNPFLNYITLDTKDKIRVAFMSVFVAPIRLILMFAALTLSYLVSVITFINTDSNEDSEPLRGWRRQCKDVANRFFFWAHVACGFYQIKVRGKRAEPWEAPILVFAPHSSLFDSLPVSFLGAPSFVGKTGLLKIPFASAIFKITQPIFVDRDSKDSRKLAAEKIQERADLLLQHKDNPDGIGWPQVAIFPEATTHNRKQLLTFKPGAFLPQLPVQPVCLRWPNSPDTITWPWEGVSVLQSFWLSLCQFQNYLEIEFLPVYVPNEEEKKDATLYASNVRAKMAECLQLPVCDYTLEDARFLTRGYCPKRMNFLKMCDELRIPYALWDDMALEDAWRRLKNSKWSTVDYKVTYDQFAQEFIRLPKFPKLHLLFNMFDWTCTSSIDLREFIIAQYANIYSYNSMKLCFEMFREQYTGIVNPENLVRILRLPYGLSLRKCKRLYSLWANSCGEALVTIDNLRNVAHQHNEFESLLRFDNNNNPQ